MPIDYTKYPKNWKSEIRPAIIQRSKGRCESCGLRNHSVGYRDSDGRFNGTCGNLPHDLAGEGLSYPLLLPLTYKEAVEFREICNESRWTYEEKYFIIVLTIAHLDHDITNNDPANLKALCQKCHLNHDKELHSKSRKATRNRNLGIQDLFEDCS